MGSLLSGCAHVTIPDANVCGDLGFQGAACFHTLSTGEVDIPKAQWDAERVGMLCESADDFAAWKLAMEDLCSDVPSGTCDEQTQATIRTFFAHVEAYKLKLKVYRATLVKP